MPTDSNSLNLTLSISIGQGADAEELDRFARQLRDEIAELEVDAVEPLAGGPIPAGAKSAEAITLGALAVAILPTILPKLIELLHAWTMRGENRLVKIKTQAGDRSVEVEYSPTTMSAKELEHLVNALTGSVSPGPA
jgi:hypothetical protein